MKVPWYFVFSFLFCVCVCLEPMVRKSTWMRTTSVTVMVIFSKVPFWKLATWWRLCSKFFLDNLKAHSQRHLRDTLQMKILQEWMNKAANSSLVKYETKVPGKQSAEQKSKPVLWRTFHQKGYMTFHLSLYPFFSLKQNLTYCWSNDFHRSFFYLFTFWYFVHLKVLHHNLFTSLPFDILYILKFFQCLNALFIRISKILVRLNVLSFEVLKPRNVFIMFLFTMAHSFSLTMKSTTDVNLLCKTILCMSDKTFGIWLWSQLIDLIWKCHLIGE